jgi:hypothetical protein
MLLRYGEGWVAGGDTAFHTRATQSIMAAGTLVPDTDVYGNGYGYQAIHVAIMHLSGASLVDLQTFGASLLIVWIVFPAWLLYRELTQTTYAATFATVLLLIQPEFLFGIMRGTHEKFTRGLILLCLYLLIRSLRSKDRSEQFAGFVVAFYICAYAMIACNNLQATSFIFASGLSLILTLGIMRSGLFQMRLLSIAGPTMRRLAFATTICLVLAFTFMFYIYPPARSNLQTIGSMGDQTASLVLDVETTEVNNPYATINSGWADPRLYPLLSLANWLLLGGSALIWSWQTLKWFVTGKRPHDFSELLLWTFYAAFTFQGALSVVMDFSGVMASNLQHRVFPNFALVATAVIARWVFQVHDSSTSLFFNRLIRVGVTFGIGMLAVLSLWKTTSEPVLSNKWRFFQPGEFYAVEWADQHLPERNVWLGFDDRLRVSHTTSIGAERSRNFIDVIGQDGFDGSVRNVVISDVLRSQSVRFRRPLPIEMDDFITYDNGQAQLYHRYPDTPYQR